MSWNFKTATSDLKDGFAPVVEGRYTMSVEDAEIKTASTGILSNTSRTNNE